MHILALKRTSRRDPLVLLLRHMQPFAFNSYFTSFGGGIFFPLLLVILLFVVILKGYALWYSARDGQKWWFIAMLVINTMGILEIVYLLFFRPKPLINAFSPLLKKDSPAPHDPKTDSV